MRNSRARARGKYKQSFCCRKLSYLAGHMLHMLPQTDARIWGQGGRVCVFVCVGHKQIKMAFSARIFECRLPLLMMQQQVACRFGSAVVPATRGRTTAAATTTRVAPLLPLQHLGSLSSSPRHDSWVAFIIIKCRWTLDGCHTVTAKAKVEADAANWHWRQRQHRKKLI